MLDLIDAPAPAPLRHTRRTRPVPRDAALPALSIWLTASASEPIAPEVHLAGELDIAARGLVLVTCASMVHRRVVVDMSELTFMDCAGYGSLMAAQLVLRARGGSLTLRGVDGQPGRLLSLIGDAERNAAGPSRGAAAMGVQR